MFSRIGFVICVMMMILIRVSSERMLSASRFNLLVSLPFCNKVIRN